MRVITKGVINWKKEIVCKSCSALLEIEKTDLQYDISDKEAMSQQYVLEPEGSYFVVCPECETTVIIRSKDIPQAVRNEIRYT